METLVRPQKLQNPNPQFMNSIFPKLKLNFLLNPNSSFSNLKPLCASKPLISSPTFSTQSSSLRDRVKVKATVAEATRQLKENWLHSLSCPFPVDQTHISPSDVPDSVVGNVGFRWVIGIDPDASGALAVLKIDDSGCSAQVFDTPQLKVLVGKSTRTRLDAKAIVHMLHGVNAPIGTTAYIEQSNPYPQDGKQGWWGGGFSYGLWIGLLVASGFSVVPVTSISWKNKFELSGSRSTKDESRKLASTLFPALSSSLQRKKDHGRAEALLIAAYGKDLTLKSDLSDSSSMLEEFP
ncbi:Holliday junction resolvase MOC1, chloroplastic-like [Euphorbia lathyris]|uniref:Holliday junction resolvase MOC1, chloroplastic-like n=1 Tax=Euphorbia lathyris TaxID=212925 RepID=UPI003313F494